MQAFSLVLSKVPAVNHFYNHCVLLSCWCLFYAMTGDLHIGIWNYPHPMREWVRHLLQWWQQIELFDCLDILAAWTGKGPNILSPLFFCSVSNVVGSEICSKPCFKKLLVGISCTCHFIYKLQHGPGDLNHTSNQVAIHLKIRRLSREANTTCSRYQ